MKAPFDHGLTVRDQFEKHSSFNPWAFMKNTSGYTGRTDPQVYSLSSGSGE